MRKRTLRILIPVLAASCVCLFARGAAHAQAFSKWDADTHSAVRLLAGRPFVQAGKSIRRAGVELKLKPGWKTFGRDPGDSGVPPVFDFGASQNVRSVHVLWPTPERLIDGAGETLGYKDGVIFPLRIEPRDSSKPVVLRVKLDYAICDVLCVPARARIELTLSGAVDDVAEAMLAAAEARVP